MSLNSEMSTLALKDNSETSLNSVESRRIVSDWENWKTLRLSSYYSKKLLKRAFKPYHPKTKDFFLHEIDNFDFKPGEKVTILMRTLKKVFGRTIHYKTQRASRLNSKLSFIRVRGLEHFEAGKNIKDLIEFPKSYWDAYKSLIEAPKIKQSSVKPDHLKRRLETVPEETDIIDEIECMN